MNMNDDRVKGNWKQMKGEVQKQWGKITDDDHHVIEGDREKLIGKVQERHGRTRDQAEEDVNKWYARMEQY